MSSARAAQSPVVAYGVDGLPPPSFPFGVTHRRVGHGHGFRFGQVAADQRADLDLLETYELSRVARPHDTELAFVSHVANIGAVVGAALEAIGLIADFDHRASDLAHNRGAVDFQTGFAPRLNGFPRFRCQKWRFVFMSP
jgi:hypothetical protein